MSTRLRRGVSPVASKMPAMIAITTMMPRITPPAMSTHPQPARPRLRGGSYAGGGGAAGGGACHGRGEAAGEGIADPSGDSSVRHSTQKRAPVSFLAPQFWQIMYYLQGGDSETASLRVSSIEQVILKCNYVGLERRVSHVEPRVAHCENGADAHGCSKVS